MEHLAEHIAATQILIQIIDPKIFEAAKVFISENKEKTKTLNDTYLWRIIIKKDDESMEIKIPRRHSEHSTYLDLMTIIMKDPFANPNIIAEVVRDSSFDAIKTIAEKLKDETDDPHYWYIKVGIYDFIKGFILESLDIKIPKSQENLFKEIMEVISNEYIPPSPSQEELETLQKELEEKLPASEFYIHDDLITYRDWHGVSYVESNAAWEIVKAYIISTVEKKLGFKIEVTEWGSMFNHGHYEHKFKRKE